MRPRLLVVALAAASAWLFLTESGRRSRDTVLSLFGFGGGEDGAPAAPLPFPRMSARPDDQQESSSPTPEEGDSSFSPATAQEEQEHPTTEDSPAPAVPEHSQQEGTVAAPQPTATGWPAAATGADAKSGEQEQATPPAGESSPAESGEDEHALPLAEVLHDLEEEMESHAIGQEPDVKVEDELTPTTLQSIGIPESGETPSPAGEAETEPAEEAKSADTRWVGNRRTMKAHPPGSGRILPAEENRVYFESREEAEGAGYSVVERELPQ